MYTKKLKENGHRQKQFFDNYAKNINTDFDMWSYAEQNMFNYLAKFFLDTQNKRILDIGCGTGRFSIRLALQAKEVIGIDISGRSIDIANKTAKKYNIGNFKGIQGNFIEHRYKEYFDYIFAVNLIHHMDQPEKMLLHIKKALKKDGIFIMLEFNPLNPLFVPFLFLIGQLKNHITKEYIRSNIFSLENLLKRSGFKKIQVYRYAFFPTTLYKYSNLFENIDNALNKIPVVNAFTAYHLIYVKKP